MRKEFVRAQTRTLALEKCPWAAVLICVTGGFWAFESSDDAEIFRKQQ